MTHIWRDPDNPLAQDPNARNFSSLMYGALQCFDMVKLFTRYNRLDEAAKELRKLQSHTKDGHILEVNDTNHVLSPFLFAWGGYDSFF